jgi:broad specificity phosphatase PhoE
LKLYFVRHGESKANVLKVFSNQGFKHPLTDKGVEQSLKLASEIKHVSFAGVYSSPILRAIETTLIITKQKNIPSFEVTESLREHNVGTLEGKSDEESWRKFFDILKEWENQNTRDYHYNFGESYNQISNRFTSFIKQICSIHCDDDNLLFISHGGLYIVGMPNLVCNIDYQFTRQNLIGNSEIILIEHKNNKFECLKWGQVQQIST